MDYVTPPPSRELAQKRLVDIIRIGHDTLDKKHLKLEEAVLGIFDFQYIENNVKSGSVYQYRVENQHDYNRHEITVTSAMGTFEPVINESKKRLFQLEMQIPSGTSFDMPQPIQKPQDTGQDQIKDNRSFMDKLKGVPAKKRIITPDDPYQDGLKFLRDTMAKMPRFERFQEYQAYGVDLALRSNYYAMYSYLKFHRTRFRFEIAPTILRVHRQFVEMIKEKEKQGAIMMGSKIDDEIWSSRNDMDFSQSS